MVSLVYQYFFPILFDLESVQRGVNNDSTTLSIPPSKHLLAQSQQ